MSTATIQVSPVNIEDRKRIGIRVGDTVRVWQKVEEKGKTRLQPFEGVVLARKHGSEPGATFTVRRMNDQYGVEKIFPLYSPMIGKIEIVKRAKVRRAKLYHIRKRAAREIKRQMRNLRFVDIATADEQTDSEGSDAENEEAQTADASKEQEVKESKEEANEQAENEEKTEEQAEEEEKSTEK